MMEHGTEEDEIIVDLPWQCCHNDGRSATTTHASSSSLPGIAAPVGSGRQWTARQQLNSNGLKGNGQQWTTQRQLNSNRWIASNGWQWMAMDGDSTVMNNVARWPWMEWRQGTAPQLLDNDGQWGMAQVQRRWTLSATAMDSNGQHDDNSMVMGSGVQRQWTARRQLEGKGWRVGDMTTMDNEDGASMMAMSTWQIMEMTKTIAASRH
jgi:hypothetical protein